MASKAVYCDYFGFSKDPFSIAPDPALLYPSEQHKQALAHLKYGLDREGGFILLTGEVGTGKTTLTRLLLQQVAGNVRVAYVLNTKLGSEGLLYSICQELEIDLPSSARNDISESIEYLNKDLLAAHRQKKKTLVVIEEAQNLGPEVLETLRLLTNLETNTTKLLHILLVAQPELLETLARQNLRQLNQRIVSRHHLQPLKLNDVSNYLNHRVLKVGGQANLFSAQSVKRLFSYSNGIPRLLNLLAERALLGVYANGQQQVTPKVVDQASEEVFGAGKSANKKNGLAFALAAAIALICLSLLIAPIFTHQDNQQKQADSTINFSLVEQQDEAVVTEQNEKLSVDSQHAGNSHQASAAQQLFKLWRPNIAMTITASNLCQSAMIENLRCESLDNLTLADIVSLNRPGIVTLTGANDSLQRYLLSSVQDGVVTLNNVESTQLLTEQELSQLWIGDYLFLWHAPNGYSHSLYPGMSNSSVVSWLLTKLKAKQPEVERLITGGVYSEAVALYVKKFQQHQGLSADGILGVQTIMALTGAQYGQPQLHIKGQN